jgi:hypothetical protein
MTNVKVIHEETPLQRVQIRVQVKTEIGHGTWTRFSGAKTCPIGHALGHGFDWFSGRFHVQAISETFTTIGQGFPAVFPLLPLFLEGARKRNPNLALKHRSTIACESRGAAPPIARVKFNSGTPLKFNPAPRIGETIPSHQARPQRRK